MNTELPNASICYGLYDNENIIGFIGVIHQPHGVNKKIKRVTRLVILPDYQGIGLGYELLKFVADLYTKQEYDFSIVTSAKNLIMKLYKSDNWVLKRLSINKCSSTKSAIDYNRPSARTQCKTASFFYKKGEEKS